MTPERAEWRSEGIGSSDASIIAGFNEKEWKKLAAEKNGAPRKKVAAQQQLLMDLGKAVEPVCLDYFSNNVHPIGKRDEKVEWSLDSYFRATLDGVTTDGIPVECKFHTGTHTAESLAQYYWPQLQHILMVSAQTSCWFAVIMGMRGKFERLRVGEDLEFQTLYQLRCFQFKHYLDNGIFPDGGAMASVPIILSDKPAILDVTNNEITSNALTFLRLRDVLPVLEAAKLALRAAMPEGVRRATWTRDGDVITLARNKAGAITVTAGKEGQDESIGSAEEGGQAGL